MLPASFFASDTPQPRTVRLPDGSDHVLHFRELPAIEFRRYFAQQSGDEDARAAAMAKLIAASLCESDGAPAIDLEQALRLKQGALNSLAREVLKVNGVAVPDEAVGEQGNV